MQGRLRTRPADLLIQPTSSLHSLELEELGCWNSPGSQSQTVTDFNVMSSPPAPYYQLMSPVSPPIAWVAQPFPSLSSPALQSPQSPEVQGEDLFATLLPQGIVRLYLGSGILLDIGNDLTLRLSNPIMESSMAVCGEARRAAIIHPGGRALFHRPRLEVQVEDQVSVKTAKLFPPGRASFTADSCALVYSLDNGGLRSTTDVFHDLHADNIVDTLFQETCLTQPCSEEVGMRLMHQSQFWRTPVSLASNLSS